MTTEKTMLPELRITSEVGNLSWNFDELKPAIAASLEKYRGMIVEEDQIQDVMKMLADLRKVRKVINDRKIEEKKSFCAPYTKFEGQVKEMTGMIDEVITELDVQVKSFDERRKEAKKQEILEWWNENGDRNIKFDLVFEDSYLNKTCTAKQWQFSLHQKVERFRADLCIITGFPEIDKKDFLITDLTKTLDLGKSLQNWEKHAEDERRVAELKARQAQAEKERQERLARYEEERRAQEIARQAEADRRRAEEAERQEAQKPAAEAQKLGPRDYLYTRTFRITDATYDEMLAVFNYLKSLGVNYETIARDMRRK